MMIDNKLITGKKGTIKLYNSKFLEDSWFEEEECSDEEYEDINHDGSGRKLFSQENFELSMLKKELNYIFDLDTTACCDSENNSKKNLQDEPKLKLKIKDRYEFLNSCINHPEQVSGENYLKYLKGRVIPMLKKKKGSILMLKYLLMAPESVLELLVQEIMIQLVALVNNCYASYFLEALLLAVNEQQQILILDSIYKNFEVHLKNKFAVRFMTAVVDLPLFSNRRIIQIAVNAIIVTPDPLENESSTIKLAIALVRRIKYDDYQQFFAIIEKKFDHLIKSNYGLQLLKTLLESQDQPKFYEKFAKLVEPFIADLLKSESGYDLCNRFAKTAKYLSTTNFANIDLKEKIEDNLYIINSKGKAKSRIIIRKIEETNSTCVVPFTSHIFYEAVISSVKCSLEKFSLTMLDTLVLIFEDLFIKRLIESSVMRSHFSCILSDTAGIKLLYSILKVSNTTSLVEFIYKLLLETKMKILSNPAHLMNLISSYGNFLATKQKCLAPFQSGQIKHSTQPHHFSNIQLQCFPNQLNSYYYSYPQYGQSYINYNTNYFFGKQG